MVRSLWMRNGFMSRPTRSWEKKTGRPSPTAMAMAAASSTGLVRTRAMTATSSVDPALGGRVVARHGRVRDLHERDVADDRVDRADEDLVEFGTTSTRTLTLIGHHEGLHEFAKGDGTDDDDAVGPVLARRCGPRRERAEDREAADVARRMGGTGPYSRQVRPVTVQPQRPRSATF